MCIERQLYSEQFFFPYFHLLGYVRELKFWNCSDGEGKEEVRKRNKWLFSRIIRSFVWSIFMHEIRNGGEYMQRREAQKKWNIENETGHNTLHSKYEMNNRNEPRQKPNTFAIVYSQSHTHHCVLKWTDSAAIQRT